MIIIYILCECKFVTLIQVTCIFCETELYILKNVNNNHS